MDIELFKTFLEVNKTRHFGKASENLYLTQAAVSARIKQLEESLGVNLFVRARNNIQLTPEGERLLPHAETMLTAWSRARQEVALKQEQKHQLSVGTTAGLWRFLLQDKLANIQQNHPELALRAEAHSAEELVKLLQEGIIDLALLFDPVELTDFTARPLGKFTLKLVSTQEGTSTKEALQSNYVYVDWGTAFSLFHAKKFADLPAPALHTNMASIAESFIRQQQGSAYLPQALLTSEASEQLIPVAGSPSFSRDIYAVFRSGTEKTKHLAGILELLTLEP
ncbi:LysR family transcriptional regulator [Pseudomaricurvus sp.]|uniref:LysR family transcriptional regulator n=1 Tax=Pseudomaricurvus sp. TaxID=2004510 RepID=UPI003F6C8271